MPSGGRRDRRVWPNLSLAVAGTLLALVVCQAIRHEDARADIRAIAAKSPAAAAQMIARRFGAAHAVCHPDMARDDIDNLISALFALERMSLSPFENTIERFGLRASHLLGLTPPDFSYGPGQIRLSRALALAPVEPAGLAGPEPWVGRQPLIATALALLDGCSARMTARRLIKTAPGRSPTKVEPTATLDHAEITQLASFYNAQAEPADAKAALAHHVFNQIAYHLTLHYRYACTPRLSGGRKARSQPIYEPPRWR